MSWTVISNATTAFKIEDICSRSAVFPDAKITWNMTFMHYVEGLGTPSLSANTHSIIELKHDV